MHELSVDAKEAYFSFKYLNKGPLFLEIEICVTLVNSNKVIIQQLWWFAATLVREGQKLGRLFLVLTFSNILSGQSPMR